MEEYIYKEECFKIIGCAMEVHKELGSGFLESVYQEALHYEFEQNAILYKEFPTLEIFYKNIVFSKKYIPDFVCFDKIIVELKVAKSISDEHYAQVLNYLKATKLKLGLILNFGCSSLEFKRVILSK
jgi:GxxExxY protein